MVGVEGRLGRITLVLILMPSLVASESQGMAVSVQESSEIPRSKRRNKRARLVCIRCHQKKVSSNPMQAPPGAPCYHRLNVLRSSATFRPSPDRRNENALAVWMPLLIVGTASQSRGQM